MRDTKSHDPGAVQQVIHVKTKKSLLFFSRYFFKQNYKNKFVVNHHHEKIAKTLEEVIQGKITRLIINMPPRYGKAIDCETEILTDFGWKKAHQIKVGDNVFGSDGRKTEILGIFHQGQTNAYKVEFTDGSNLVTCGEHIWSVNNKERIRRESTKSFIEKTTSQLIDDLHYSDGHKKWFIPRTEPIHFDDKLLPIDPYLLGCWLGDGHTNASSITTMDKEIVRSFEDHGFELKKHKHQSSGKAFTYSIKNGFYNKLKTEGLFGRKRIPEKYFLCSKRQRLSLLKGLMDTDGTVNRKNGQISYCSTKEKLLLDVMSLCRSLGFFTIRHGHNLFIKTNEILFNLSRKAQLQRPLNSRHFIKRYIKSIKRVDDRSTVCFYVGAKDSLYLAGKDFILTHNTQLAVKYFVAHCLALNPAAKFIHLSAADDLALDNSEEIRDLITSEAFTDLFPGVSLKQSTKGKKKWYTTRGGGVYATSAGGQITGFGAGSFYDDEQDKNDEDEFFNEIDQKEEFGGAIIIDDPIKPDDSESSIKRDRVNNRYDTTIKNRVNSRKTPIIIVMQRLHPNDLCGHVLKTSLEDWHVLKIPAISEEDGERKALWEYKHTLKELDDLRGQTPLSIVTFDRQYQQNPKPLKGLLYTTFLTYDKIPGDGIIYAYVDTADEGDDYLCSIVWEEIGDMKYILDVIYTQEANEITELQVAEQFDEYDVNYAKVESNNGGRAFARNVKRIGEDDLRNLKTDVSWFHQSKNKMARIKSESSTVQKTIVYPQDWTIRWPEFYDSMTGYMAAGGNDHDDAQDAITGVAEGVSSHSVFA